MGGVAGGVVGAVVAWADDRLHRSPRELEDFIDAIESAGVVVATVGAGDYDFATAQGRANARQAGVRARLESERKSERLKLKHEELAK
jgi:site-specific DNA recombinase